jgi:uncharacterized protein (TIGR02145 family)
MILLVLGIWVWDCVWGCDRLIGQEKSDQSGVFTDSRDNHSYQWVKIGTQTWMAENLAFLPKVSSSFHFSNSGSYYVYDYEDSVTSEAVKSPKYLTYGTLYNWESAKTACPPGWRLPKDEDWTQLTDHLDPMAGGKLKEAGTDHWARPNTNGGNESGFTALPGGFRNNDGGFESIGNHGYFWSSTEYDTLHAWARLLSYGRNSVSSYSGNKNRGFSVRCIKFVP